MNFDTLLQSRQFRGKRARNGKLCRNRVGAYERSRSLDTWSIGKSKKQLLEEIRGRDLASDQRGSELACESENCACIGEGLSGDSRQSLIDCDGGVVLLRFLPGGKLSSAHFMSEDRDEDFSLSF